MEGNAVQTTLLLAGALGLGVAAWHDLRTRLIPNRAIAFTAVCGLINGFSAALSVFLLHLAVVATVFVLLWVLVEKGWLGGGDAKMIPASLLLVDFHYVVPLLANIVIAGGAIALIMLILRSLLGGKAAFPATPLLAPPDPISMRDQIAAGVPYGVAIWLGLLATIGASCFWT